MACLMRVEEAAGQRCLDLSYWQGCSSAL